MEIGHGFARLGRVTDLRAIISHRAENKERFQRGPFNNETRARYKHPKSSVFLSIQKKNLFPMRYIKQIFTFDE